MSKNEEIKEIIEVLENLEQFTSNTPRERLNSAIQHFQDYLRIAESGMPKELPVNPNSSHCSQCGRDFYSFNNGYNKAIEECILSFQHNFSVERLEEIVYPIVRKSCALDKCVNTCPVYKKGCGIDKKTKEIVEALHKEMIGEGK